MIQSSREALEIKVLPKEKESGPKQKEHPFRTLPLSEVSCALESTTLRLPRLVPVRHLSTSDSFVTLRGPAKEPEMTG